MDADNRWEMDCLLICMDSGLPVDRGRAVGPIDEYAVEPFEAKVLDIRLYACRFVC